jgi:hypothetical protein
VKWLDAKKLEADIAMLTPLAKAGASLAPGDLGMTALDLFEALTDPKTVEAVVGVVNMVRGATPPPTA